MKLLRTMELGDHGRLLVTADAISLFEAAAELVVQSAAEAVAARGRFTIGLSGGSTPKALYALLAAQPWRDRIDWPKTHFFWSDERWVPPTDKQSNSRMVHETLLSKVSVPAENIHRIETGSGEPQESAAKYEQEIRKIVGERPQIDLNLLGLGTNGHTASLFPHQPALKVRDRLVVADYIDEVKMSRITFTVSLINESRTILFLVSGNEKAPVLREVLGGPQNTEQLPAQLIRAKDGKLIWLADAAASADLK